MSTLNKFFLTIGLTLLSGCGIKFTYKEIQEDHILPPAIEDSIPATIYRHDLNTLTGQIAVVDVNGKMTPVLRAIDPDHLPIVRSIPEANGVLYRSIISQGNNVILKAASSGADLTGNQKAELIISQIAESTLQEIPRNQVLEKSALVTLKPDQKLVYIRGSVLSLVKTQLYDEIDANSTVTYGPVFGFNGKVYQASEQLRNDYIITLSTVDVDTLRDGTLTKVNTTINTAKELTAPAPTSPQLPQIMETSMPLPPQTVNVRAPAVEKPEQPPSSLIAPVQVEVSPPNP